MGSVVSHGHPVARGRGSSSHGANVPEGVVAPDSQFASLYNAGSEVALLGSADILSGISEAGSLLPAHSSSTHMPQQILVAALK